MEDRVYCAKVERLNRLQTVLMLWMAVLISFVLSEFVSERWGIVIPGEIILVGILVMACVLLVKLEPYFPATEEVEAVFGIDEVVFTKGKRRKNFYMQR